MKPFKGCGTESHDNGAESKEPNATLKRELLEDRVRIPGKSLDQSSEARDKSEPSVMLKTAFNPEPVADSDCTG
jgi:hypothetical protein